jgi:signal transduction histidine kinase
MAIRSTVGWLFAAIPISAGLFYAMQFPMAEEKITASAKMAVSAKRSQIFSGDVKTAEIQMRNDLGLSEDDRLFFLDEKKQPWITQFDDLKLSVCEPDGSVCNNYLGHKLVTYYPIYFDNDRTNLWGYLYLEQMPSSNWTFAIALTLLFFVISLFQNFSFYAKSIREISVVSSILTSWSETLLANPKAPSLDKSAPYSELQPVENALSLLTHEITELERAARNEGALTTLRAVGHDILNPVSRIKRLIGIIQTERSDVFGNEDELLINLNRNVKRLSDYAEQLKFMYKRETGEILDRQGISNVSSEVRTLISELQFDPEVIDRNVEITSSIEDDCLVQIPSPALGRMVENICANGINATSASGKIHVSVAAKDQKVVLDIDDTGSGIPAHLEKKVFEAGFTSRPNKGTGLGLFVVKQICEQYGGTIEMKSTPGKGTRVRIELPRTEAANVV